MSDPANEERLWLRTRVQDLEASCRAARVACSKLEGQRDALRKQLPAEMQDCTIRFVECPVGHGRLTATNWIDHGCPQCEIVALRAALPSSPEAVKPTIPDVVARFRAYYELNPAWGSLHIVLDDGNVEDSRVDFLSRLGDR